MNKSSEIIGQEMAILAHELREPLASILFAVECTNETGHDEFASRRMCEVVQRQVRYLARIIDDMLDASQLTQGRLSLHKELIVLRTVIETAIETNTPLLAKCGHCLTVSLPVEPILLAADPLRVQQIVNNLLTNAGKYTEPGGSISVAVEAVGGVARIEVRDTGIGISSEALPRVFDLFHQGSDRPQGGFSGLGIGLALVKSLVEMHGGTITVHSDGVGTGSSFVVRLPGVTTVSRQNPDLAGPPGEQGYAVHRTARELGIAAAKC
jgi:signal transduction histidine kinase